MRVPKLPEAEIERHLADLPEWTRREDALCRTYIFKSFRDAVAFVVALADAAEAADHHPDIDIRCRKVTLVLTTHDVRGLTAKDMALAREADQVAAALRP